MEGRPVAQLLLSLSLVVVTTRRHGQAMLIVLLSEIQCRTCIKLVVADASSASGQQKGVWTFVPQYKRAGSQQVCADWKLHQPLIPLYNPGHFGPDKVDRIGLEVVCRCSTSIDHENGLQELLN